MAAKKKALKAMRKKAAAARKPAGKINPHKPGRKRAGPPRLLAPSKRGPGAACKRMREKNGMNQRQLAEKIGYTQPHISNIERGAIAPSEELVEAYKKACSGKRVTKKVAKKPAKKVVAKKIAKKAPKAKRKPAAKKSAPKKAKVAKKRAPKPAVSPAPATPAAEPAAAE